MRWNQSKSVRWWCHTRPLMGSKFVSIKHFIKDKIYIYINNSREVIHLNDHRRWLGVLGLSNLINCSCHCDVIYTCFYLYFLSNCVFWSYLDHNNKIEYSFVGTIAIHSSTYIVCLLIASPYSNGYMNLYWYTFTNKCFFEFRVS